MEFEDVPFVSHQKQDPPITYDLFVTYEELFSGTKKKMKVVNNILSNMKLDIYGIFSFLLHFIPNIVFLY